MLNHSLICDDGLCSIWDGSSGYGYLFHRGDLEGSDHALRICDINLAYSRMLSLVIEQSLDVYDDSIIDDVKFHLFF